MACWTSTLNRVGSQPTKVGSGKNLPNNLWYKQTGLSSHGGHDGLFTRFLGLVYVCGRTICVQTALRPFCYQMNLSMILTHEGPPNRVTEDTEKQYNGVGNHTKMPIGHDLDGRLIDSESMKPLTVARPNNV